MCRRREAEDEAAEFANETTSTIASVQPTRSRRYENARNPLGSPLIKSLPEAYGRDEFFLLLERGGGRERRRDGEADGIFRWKAVDVALIKSKARTRASERKGRRHLESTSLAYLPRITIRTIR